MRRRQKPEPEPEPLNTVRIRELVQELAEAQAQGESVHCHPSQYELDELATCWAGYYAQSMLGHPDGPRGADVIADYIIDNAPQWKSQFAERNSRFRAASARV